MALAHFLHDAWVKRTFVVLKPFSKQMCVKALSVKSRGTGGAHMVKHGRRALCTRSTSGVLFSLIELDESHRFNQSR